MLVLDHEDAGLAKPVEAIGIKATVTGTIMRTDEDKVVLAREAMRLVDSTEGAPC